MERGLIAQYESDIAMAIERLDARRYEAATEIASWPELVRGYDTVKDEHIAALEEKRGSLLASLADPVATIPSRIAADRKEKVS